MTKILPQTLLAAVASAMALAATPVRAAPAAANPDIPSAEVKRALQGLAPAGLRITDVAMKGQKATIKGGSQTNDQVSRFLRAVEASKDFKAPSLTSIAKDPATGGSSFEIAAEVQCPKPGEKVEDSLCAPPSKQAAQSIYKCRVNGTFTVQATPCEK